MKGVNKGALGDFVYSWENCLAASKEKRIQIILKDLINPSADLSWGGGLSRAEIMSTLMKRDISPDEYVDVGLLGNDGQPPLMRMLHYFMGEENDLFIKLLEMGASITTNEMDVFIDCLGLKATKKGMLEILPNVMDRLDEWKDMDHPKYPGKRLLDVLKEVAPMDYVQWERDQMNGATALIKEEDGAHHKQKSPRL